MEAKSLLYASGLYKGLDFWISGKTFDQGGLIKIECDLYSDSAISLEESIRGISLDLGKREKLNRALSQIVAEETEVLHIKDTQKLLDGLATLNQKPWLEKTVVDTKNIRVRNDCIYLAENQQSAPRILKTIISLDPTFSEQHRELLPLFNIFSRWLIFTPDDIIADRNGYYSGDIYADPKTVSTIGEMQIAPHLSRDVDTDTLFESTKETITKMCLPHILDRLAKDIWQSVDKNSDSSMKPDLDRILIETEVYASYDELRNDATLENLKLLSEHLFLEVRFGRRKVSGQLALPKKAN